MTVPQRITDLSRGDFTEIARVANISAEDGIVIDQRGDRLVLRLDQAWLKNWLEAQDPPES